MTEKTDEELLEEQQKQQEKQRKDELDDIRYALKNESARRLLRRILGRAGLHRSSFDSESDRFMAFNEGRRDIALWLFAEIGEADPDGIGRFLTEVQKVQHIDETKV